MFRLHFCRTQLYHLIFKWKLLDVFWHCTLHKACRGDIPTIAHSTCPAPNSRHDSRIARGERFKPHLERYEISYTRAMKTAISLPDLLFERGEAYAQQRSISRSELFARALEEYLERHDHAAITAQLNEVYAVEDSSLEPGIEALSLEALRNQDWSP